MFRRVKGVVIGTLAGAMLLTFMSQPARSQVEQIPWDQKSYDQLAPADTSETIAPGTHINMQNWQQYKKFMPVGLWVLFGGNQHWKLPANAELEVGAPTHIPLPKKYL